MPGGRGPKNPPHPPVVSGQGPDSARTDQSALAFKSTGYGEGQVTSNLDQVSRQPSPNQVSPPTSAAGGGGVPSAPSTPAGPDQGVFYPSDRPYTPTEPILAPDPDLALRALYQAAPHADILKLLEGRSNGYRR